jgi:acyl transferase domain-containing protein/NAD(P)-dependent dehydrogenase (short-subunit alcohol dehydrogenase family)/acyl carrier protein
MKRYDIAIIGMGGVFPGARNVEQYWENIREGSTFITDMPEKYWRWESYFSKDRGLGDKSYTEKGSFIDNFEFPFTKYKFPPNTWKGVDPSQLIALESAREALEDAGIKPHSEALDEAVTILGVSGVDDYAHASAYLRRNHYFERLEKQLKENGVSDKIVKELHTEFEQEVLKRHPVKMSLLAIGAIPSALSNRVAQVFGTKGYNMTVDAACASSFGALETACHALMAGDARVAITGGVDLGVNPAIYIGFSRVEGLSFSGIANPFDHKADGLVIGEGCGVVILKKLEDAISDGDEIKGIIRGMGSSSDGAGQAIYSPSVKGRARAFRMALERAELTPDDVQFIEAHATSTVVGDANEYDAIAAAYAKGRSKNNPLYLGSVKYQIGHLKAAAGVAGLIKTIKGMQTGTMPHMPLFEKLTPNVSEEVDSFLIPNETSDWKLNKEGKRIAAVTSSGFGGCNYHVIIEQGENYVPVNKRPKIKRDIAVVGVACRVAEADDIDTFWDNVTSGRKVFSKADPVELNWRHHVDKGPENERIHTKLISKLKPYSIDYLKYKILPKSVSQISPTQFLGLDLAGRLLESKGFNVTEPKNIGVSIGAIHDDSFPDIFDPMISDDFANAVRETKISKKLDDKILEKVLTDTKDSVTKETPPITEHTLPGWMGNIVAGRMANKLNLQGPNMVVDSACSSGLSALIPAIYQLAFGDIDMMISGGLNRQLSDVFTSGVSAIGALAKEDAKPFDEEGAGYVIGDGGVLYLLKRLEDAKKDGDDILAVIHSVNGTSEAESKSMLAPSESAVRRAIRRTLRNTDVDKSRIGVVDTHGSANKASDVIEGISVAKEVGKNIDGEPVSITAIKSHIGHLYGGSGASSMLSIIQTLRTRKVPGIRNLKNIRPELNEVLDKAIPVKLTKPLHSAYDAGAVLSLGLGGTNYFAVVTLGDKEESKAEIISDKQEIKMSKKSENRTEKGADIFTGSSPDLNSLKKTISNCIEGGAVSSSDFANSHSVRFALTYGNENELSTKLKSVSKFLDGGHDLLPLENQGIFVLNNIKEDEKLAFCFPGQGTHYITMGKFLYDSNSTFKKVVDEVHELSMKEMGFDLLAHIYGDPESEEIQKNMGTLTGAQVSLFAIEVALAKVLEEKGIIPDVLVGHSFGEISALTFAGVWDIKSGFKVVKARIEAAQFAKESNDVPLGMMSIVCSEEQRDRIINFGGGKLILTNINAPGRFVLAGELDHVKETVSLAESFGLEARLLPIGSAFHSKYMEPAKDKFRSALAKLSCGNPGYQIMSTVTGEYIPSKLTSKKIANHLSLQLTTQLNLPREIEHLHSEGVNHYLEVGPGWSMTKMISEILKGKHFKALPTMHPKIGDAEVFSRAVAFLTVTGHFGSLSKKRRISDFIVPEMLDFIKSKNPETFEALVNLHNEFVKEYDFDRPTSQTSPTESQTGPTEERIKEELAKMTGYPLDMLESELDLEADLGIDSIQRAELWVNLSKEFGISDDARPKSPVKTITGLAKAFSEASGGVEASPVEKVNSAVSEEKKNEFSYELALKSDSSWNLFARNWQFTHEKDLEDYECNNILVFADKKDHISDLKQGSKKLGIGLDYISPSDFLKKDDKKQEKILKDIDTIVYMGHYDLVKMDENKKSVEAFYLKTKELFELFKALYSDLSSNGKRIIVPVAKNSAFENFPKENGIFSSFPTGFFRSLQNELQNCSVVVINGDPENWNDTILKNIGVKTTFVDAGEINNATVKSVVSKINIPKQIDHQLDENDLVLVTGGARGIVFECVAALADKTGCKLLLTGRTPVPGDEVKGVSLERNNLATSIRNLEMKLVKEEKMSLKDAKKEAARLKSLWEVNDNLLRLEKNGIKARYEKCDVSNHAELEKLISRIKKEGEEITGIVHGAGVQKSKMLPDLEMEDILRTIETKMNPLFAMFDLLDWKKVRFFNSFTSIAGLFGNAGQTDYAFANDMLAEMTLEIKAKYPHIQVSAVDWTAWSGTGMVSDAEAKRFVESGLIPIDVENGVKMFLVAASDNIHSRLAVFNEDAAFAKNSVSKYSLSSSPFKTLSQTHSEPLKVNFSLERDLYLHQHVVNGAPVVPGTFVSEIFAENLLKKGSSISGLKFRRPLAVKDNDFNVELVEVEDKVFAVPAKRPSLEGKALENLSFSSCDSKADIKAEKPDWIKFDGKKVMELFNSSKKEKSSFYNYLDEKFSHALKTGPIFRGIVSTVEDDEIYYSLVSLTKDAVTSFAVPGEFKFNPVLADMAVQVASAWNMKKQDVMAIPFEIEKFNVFADTTSSDSVVVSRIVKMTPEESTFDVAVFEKDGTLIFTMDKLTLKTIAGLE